MAHQIHRSPAYLSRNKHSYCFRIRVPTDVQPYFGKKELRYSLGTGYVGKAKSEARRLAGIVQQLIQYLRSSRSRFMDLTEQEIQQLVVQYLNKIKAGYDKPVGPDVIPPFDDETELRDYLETLDSIKSDLRLDIATGNYDHARDKAYALLKELFPDGDAGGIDESSLAFLKLCEGLMRAEIKGIDYHNRTAFLPERKDMMQTWADYLDGLKAGAKVIPIKKKV